MVDISKKDIFVPKEFRKGADQALNDIEDLRDEFEHPDGVLLKRTIKKGVPTNPKGRTSECFRVLYKVFIAPESDEQSTVLFQQNSPDDYLEFYPSANDKMPAIETAVLTMDEGEIARLFVSYHFGFDDTKYKSKDGAELPPKTNLIVELHLIQILGESIIGGRSKDMYRRQIVDGKGYDGPDFFANITANVDIIVDGKNRKTIEIVNERLGTSPKIFKALNRALKTMCKGEITQFYVKSKYCSEFNDPQSENMFINRYLLFKVELIDFVYGADYNGMDFDEKIKTARLFLEIANELTKNGDENSLYRAVQAYKMILNRTKSFCQINDGHSEFEDSAFCEEEEQEKQSEPTNDSKPAHVIDQDKDARLVLKKSEKSDIIFKCESNMSLCYMKQNKLFKALEAIDKALNKQPNNLKLLSRKLKILVDQNDTKKAMLAIDKMLEIETGNKYALEMKKFVEEREKHLVKQLENQYKNMWNCFGSENTK